MTFPQINQSKAKQGAIWKTVYLLGEEAVSHMA